MTQPVKFSLKLARQKGDEQKSPETFMREVTEQGRVQFKDPTFTIYAMTWNCDYCGKSCPEDVAPFDCPKCKHLHDHCPTCRHKNYCPEK